MNKIKSNRLVMLYALWSYLGMSNALLYRTQVSKVAVMSNFNCQLRKIKSNLKCLFMLEDGTSCFHKGKKVVKDGEEVPHTVKSIAKDSVELAGLCKLLFFTI